MPIASRNVRKLLAVASALALSAPALAQSEETWLLCQRPDLEGVYFEWIAMFRSDEVYSYQRKTSELFHQCLSHSGIQMSCKITPESIVLEFYLPGRVKSVTTINRLTGVLTETGYVDKGDDRTFLDVHSSCERIEDPRPKAKF